jgi:O-antigen/teichoic acid export membrane protein
MLFKGGTVTLVVLVLIAFFRSEILFFFYGEEYIEYVNVLLGYTSIYFLVFIGTMMGFVIKTFEMNNIFFCSYIITTIFSLMAAKYLIAETGIYGVLIGLFATQLINISFYILKLNSKLKILWK